MKNYWNSSNKKAQDEQEMKLDMLEKAVDLAKKVGWLLIATADHAGMSHIAAAARIKLTDQNHIAVTEWFCPGTVGKLQENSKISVVMWNPKSDSGWQLLGQVEKVDDLSMLDGYDTIEYASNKIWKGAFKASIPALKMWNKTPQGEDY